MDRRHLIVVLGLTTFAAAAYPETSSLPVRILKQINRQNEDGSYNYGYENEDGSYKIETKTANGDVSGKYGYIDATGKLREIEYGASRRGFEPVGPGITVPPPTLHVQNGNAIEAEYDDGQYREDPSIYDRTDAPLPKYSAPRVPLTAHQAPSYRYNAQPLQQANQYPLYRQVANAYADPAYYQVHHQQQQQQQQARNYDPYTGSYTVNFKE